MVSPAEMKGHITEILKGSELDNLSAKKVREEIEQRMSLEQGALKPEKDTISKLIDEVLSEQETKDEPEDEDDEEEEEEEKPKKGQKRKAADSEPEPGKQPKSTCVTRSGEEPPKKLKEEQAKMKGMSTSKFLSSGPTLEIDLCGNKLSGPPRTFSSGNKGWYMNGKVEIPVGDKMVWAQVGMNISIPGSASWK